MGTYLNPGNAGFARIRKTEYIDKTGMLVLLNQRMGTPQSMTCISRARRFGKSFAAQMLCAYYDCTCDSSELFEDLAIAKDPSYLEYMNQYHVIYVDMTYLKPYTHQYMDVSEYLQNIVTDELSEAFPELTVSHEFSTTLIRAAELSGRQFFMIIDEWDAPIRENQDSEKRYLEFLRSLFKSSATTAKIFAGVYMTGILPIKKDGSQSAISDFREYTMIKPRQFGKYAGFTETEVSELCRKYDMDFERMRQWYDGYRFSEAGSVYNPNSVMQAIENNDFDSYWAETSAAEGLMRYISSGYTGLSKTIAELIGGISVQVDTAGFANDLTSFRTREDVITLLIHLGYLAYDADDGTVRIPNEEIRKEFYKTVRTVNHEETAQRLRESEQLISDTIHMNEQAVAAQIEKVHEEETVPLHYNREDSLRSVIKLAFYTYRDHYLQWEELPGGRGYADILYLPRRGSEYPAILIELKWNKSAKTAIDQIMSMNYPNALNHFGGELLLVGISYDKDASPGERKHSCIIRKIEIR